MKGRMKWIVMLSVLPLLLGCPHKQPRPTPQSPTPSAQPLTPPSPGPIIILRPNEINPGIFQTSWNVAGNDCSAAGATQSGSLRLDAWGKVLTLRVWKKDLTFVDLTTSVQHIVFTLVDGNNNPHDIEIKRTAKGYLVWKAGGSSFQICDLEVSECLPNCESTCGLPSELFGTFVNNPSNQPHFDTVSLSDLDRVEIKADYTNPCQ